MTRLKESGLVDDKWLSAPDSDGFWWFTGHTGKVVLVEVTGPNYTVCGQSMTFYARQPELSYIRWKKIAKPDPPPKPVDITKWHPGNPTQPGLWWVHMPEGPARVLSVTAYELGHRDYGFPDGTRCAYIGGLPGEPQEQS